MSSSKNNRRQAAEVVWTCVQDGESQRPYQDYGVSPTRQETLRTSGVSRTTSKGWLLTVGLRILAESSPTSLWEKEEERKKEQETT